MLKTALAAAIVAATVLVPAQAQTTAPSSPAKKELVAKLLQLQQPAIEAMARQLAEQPAAQMMQQAGPVLQRLPAERRDAVARDIEADVRKYVDETTPIVRERAIKLAPSTVGALLEERFTEDELRQVLALLESPINRKFQQLAPEMQRSITEKLVAETRGDVEPKVRALEASMRTRLAGPAGAAPAPASGNAKPATKK